MSKNTNDETMGCTFQWKIVNISHCWLKKEGHIDSPSFTAEALECTKWKLRLFPKGRDNENKLEFYLVRDQDCSEPNVNVDYQLTFLGKGGSLVKETEVSSITNFKKDVGRGFFEYESLENVFVQEREVFLPEDTLTVQCAIWNLKKKKPTDPKHLYAQTVFEVNRKSFAWKIDKFSTLKYGVLNNFSDSFIEFNLFLSEGLNFENKLVIKVKTLNEDIKYFSIKTSIVDSKEIRENYGTHEYFVDDLKTEVVVMLPSTNKWMENKSRYFPNDVLSLECECVYSTGAILYKSFGCSVFSHKSTNEVTESRMELGIRQEESVNTAELVKDLQSMYNDAIFSNTTLRTSMQTFPAHKGLLSARSPVFRSKFSNMKKGSGHVDITDFEDDTIRRMLLYIYTDSLDDDLQFESASKLYKAAEKYQILSLRSRCSSFLIKNLCPTNACDVLVLADLHDDDYLKSAVQDYMLEQRKQIFRSLEWKDFMSTHLKLAADVMYKKIDNE